MPKTRHDAIIHSPQKKRGGEIKRERARQREMRRDSCITRIIGARFVVPSSSTFPPADQSVRNRGQRKKKKSGSNESQTWFARRRARSAWRGLSRELQAQTIRTTSIDKPWITRVLFMGHKGIVPNAVVVLKCRMIMSDES